MNHAEEMLSYGVIGLRCQHAAIQSLCAAAIALLVQHERLLQPLELRNSGRLVISLGARIGCQRAVTVLETLAAAAVAGIVAGCHRHRRSILGCRGKSRPGLRVPRDFLQDAMKDRAGGLPEGHCDAIAPQLKEL